MVGFPAWVAGLVAPGDATGAGCLTRAVPCLPEGEWQVLKRVLARVGAVLVALVVTLALWTWLSPWPSVLLIRVMWPEATTEQEQAMEAQRPAGISAQHDVVVDATDPDGRIDIYRPEAAVEAALPTIVWVHGGGFVTGTKNGMDTYLDHIAAAGFTVVAVEYTVAPNAQYPRPVQQVTRAVDFLVTHAQEYGVDPDQMVLAGDSAGAHIAAQTAMAIAQPGYSEDAGLDLPELSDIQANSDLQATVLYSGAFDMTLMKSSEGMGRWMVQTMLWAYTGSKDPASDPHLEWASLPQHVDSDFPSSFISTGPADPLLSHSESMADHLEAQGVQVDTLWFPDAPDTIGHEYQMDLRTPQAKESMKALLAFLRTHLDTPVPLEAPADLW